MILSDFDLRNYVREGRLRIEPMSEDTIRENGVDLRLGNQIARLRQTDIILDPRNLPDIREFFIMETGESFVIQPYEKVLVSTLERVELPPDLMGFVELRSTFARCGLLMPPTIIDGGFRGSITLEIMGSSFPVKLHSGERFAHIVFAKLTSPLSKPYTGKYQDQKGVTLPRFDR
ncbi:MAG: dCTP deaminase [Candidatus Hecatellales archaeon]|nr:MAG: dCTP deaminase [Candidatus Hecatellales archaeon]